VPETNEQKTSAAKHKTSRNYCSGLPENVAVRTL